MLNLPGGIVIGHHVVVALPDDLAVLNNDCSKAPASAPFEASNPAQLNGPLHERLMRVDDTRGIRRLSMVAALFQMHDVVQY